MFELNEEITNISVRESTKKKFKSFAEIIKRDTKLRGTHDEIVILLLYNARERFDEGTLKVPCIKEELVYHVMQKVKPS